MMNKASLIFLMIFPAISSFAGLRAYFDYKIFEIPGQGPFIETHINFDGRTLKYQEYQDSTVKAEVQTTIIIRQGEEIIDFRKLNIFSPVLSDNASVEFIDVQRFPVPPGNYVIELELSDVNRPEETPFTFDQPVSILDQGGKIAFSSIELVQAYAKAAEPSELTKSGLDILPYVSNYYSSNMNSILFYAEAYNAASHISDKYLLTYYLETLGGRAVEGSQKYVRQEPQLVTPIIHSFDISELKSGDYNIVVEARDKDNNTLALEKMPITRFKIDEYVTPDQIRNLNTDNSFVADINSRDSLSAFLRCLGPLASLSERRTINAYADGNDITSMKNYFYYFWSRRDSQNPQAAWEQYKAQVAKAEDMFGTQTLKGFETDRGRVYLQYGEPDTRVKRHNETEVYPYEVWHYYRIQNLNNKRFLFYDPSVVTQDFVLLHSDMIGEIQTQDWLHIVSNKLLTNKPTDSQENAFNAQDSFSRNELEDLFYNPR